MHRLFNTAGPCLADRHYMIPPTRRLSQVRTLIRNQSYFVIHAARQTGKTTLLRNLSRELTAEGDYAALTVSLESFTEPDVAQMIPQILYAIEYAARYQLPDSFQALERASYVDQPHAGLKAYLSDWSAQLDHPLVVFFDEVDSLPGPVLLSSLVC